MGDVVGTLLPFAAVGDAAESWVAVVVYLLSEPKCTDIVGEGEIPCC